MIVQGMQHEITITKNANFTCAMTMLVVVLALLPKEERSEIWHKE
jgi:hypothetical protein